MVRLVLTQVDVMKLHAVDVQKSSFHAQIWLELVVKDGALDPSLTKESREFPIDPATGRPTFKPSLTWYMNQVDSRNALSHRVVDAKVLRRGNDLAMAIRLDGTFHEVFELDDYPVDTQGLSMMVTFNCRVGGPVPVELDVDPACKTVMSCVHTCPPAKEWQLVPELHMRTFNFGEAYSTDRVFSALTITATVRRRPFYAVLNFCIPMGLFSLLSLLQGSVTDANELNHRAQLTMVMVLTATAFKMAIAGKLPAISYLTLLDQYIQWNFGIIVLFAIETRLLAFDYFVPDSAEDSGNFDNMARAVLGCAWLAVQLLYLLMLCTRYFRPVERDANLMYGGSSGCRTSVTIASSNSREVTEPTSRRRKTTTIASYRRRALGSLHGTALDYDTDADVHGPASNRQIPAYDAHAAPPVIRLDASNISVSSAPMELPAVVLDGLGQATRASEAALRPAASRADPDEGLDAQDAQPDGDDDDIEMGNVDMGD